jgi:hypothetical protein
MDRPSIDELRKVREILRLRRLMRRIRAKSLDPERELVNGQRADAPRSWSRLELILRREHCRHLNRGGFRTRRFTLD